jgi:hypothetical protein
VKGTGSIGIPKDLAICEAQKPDITKAKKIIIMVRLFINVLNGSSVLIGR